MPSQTFVDTQTFSIVSAPSYPQPPSGLALPVAWPTSASDAQAAIGQLDVMWFENQGNATLQSQANAEANAIRSAYGISTEYTCQQLVSMGLLDASYCSPSTVVQGGGTPGPVLPAPTGLQQVGSATTTTAEITCNPVSGATLYVASNLNTGQVYGQGSSLPLQLSGLPVDAATPVVIQVFSGSTPGGVSQAILISTSAPTPSIGPTPGAPQQVSVTYYIQPGTAATNYVATVTENISTSPGGYQVGALAGAGSFTFQGGVGTTANTYNNQQDPLASSAYYALAAGSYSGGAPTYAYTNGPARALFAAILAGISLVNLSIGRYNTNSFSFAVDNSGDLVSADANMMQTLQRFGQGGSTLSEKWAYLVASLLPEGWPPVGGTGMPQPQVLGG